MREAASSCAAFAIGGKYSLTATTTNTTAFEHCCAAGAGGARGFMVRNNSLDWVIAAGNAKGSHKRAVKVDAEHFARMVHKKRAHDEQDFRAMRAAAARARVPFLSLVYEELCADRRKLHALFQFLGVADDSDDARAMTAALVTADGDKRAKVHARTHRQEFGNYDEVKAAFGGWTLRYLQMRRSAPSQRSHYRRRPGPGPANAAATASEVATSALSGPRNLANLQANLAPRPSARPLCCSAQSETRDCDVPPPTA